MAVVVESGVESVGFLEQLGSTSVPQFDIFISHATEDLQQALRLERAFPGYQCFVASDDLNASLGTKQWSEAIEALLASVPVLVLLVTTRSLDSSWVKFEWRSFHDDILSERRAGLIVPIVWDDLAVDKLPSAIRYWQVVDFAKIGEAEGITDVLEQIDGFRHASLSSDSPLFRRLSWSRSDRPSTNAPPVVMRPRRVSVPYPRTRNLVAGVVAMAVVLAAGFMLARRPAAATQSKQGTIAPRLTTVSPPISSKTADPPVPSPKSDDSSKPVGPPPPSAGLPTAKTAPRKPPISKPDCNPSFTVNEQGQKFFKLGCF